MEPLYIRVSPSLQQFRTQHEFLAPGYVRLVTRILQVDGGGKIYTQRHVVGIKVPFCIELIRTQYARIKCHGADVVRWQTHLSELDVPIITGIFVGRTRSQSLHGDIGILVEPVTVLVSFLGCEDKVAIRLVVLIQSRIDGVRFRTVGQPSVASSQGPLLKDRIRPPQGGNALAIHFYLRSFHNIDGEVACRTVSVRRDTDSTG